MPRYQAKLSDGRTVLFEADDQPTEDDILGAVEQHETLAKGIEASTRTATDVLRNIASPAAAMASQMGRAQIEKPKLQRQQREAQVAGDIAASEAASAGVGEQVAEFARTFPQRAVKAPFELAQAAGIPIGKPTLSPDDIAYLRDQYAKLQSPLIGPQQAGPKEQAITDWLNEQASGMTSPEMVAAVGTPMAAKLAKMSPEAIGEAGRLIARGFQAQMAAGVPEAVQATVEAPDTPSRIKAGLSATAAVGLPLAIEAGLTKPTPKIPDYPGSRIQSPERGVVTALGNEEMQAEAKKQAAMLELGRAAAKDLVPAIETPEGRVVTGEDHVGAYSEAKSTGTPDTSGSKEGFLNTKTGEFQSREKSAEQTGLPTETEAGKLHSSDLAKAQEAVTPTTVDAIAQVKSTYGQETVQRAFQEYLKAFNLENASERVKGVQLALFAKNILAKDPKALSALEVATQPPPPTPAPVKAEPSGADVYQSIRGDLHQVWVRIPGKPAIEVGSIEQHPELSDKAKAIEQANKVWASREQKPIPPRSLPAYGINSKDVARQYGMPEDFYGTADERGMVSSKYRTKEYDAAIEAEKRASKIQGINAPTIRRQARERTEAEFRKIVESARKAEPSAPPPPAQPKGETGAIAPVESVTPHEKQIADVGIPKRVPPIITTPEETKAWLAGIKAAYPEPSDAARRAIDSLKEFAKSGKYYDASSRFLGNLVRALGVDISHKGGDTSLASLGANKIRIANQASLFHELGHVLLLQKSGGMPWPKVAKSIGGELRGEWKALQDADWALVSRDKWDYWTQQTERYASLLNLYVTKNAKFKALAPELYAKVEKLLDESASTVTLFQEARKRGESPYKVLNDKLSKLQEPPTPPPVEQKGVEPEKGPGMVGMGGATPQEFEQPGTYVSNMFAAIDRDRAELGKPTMDPTVRRSWGEDNQRALAQMNRNPNWIPNLIREVLKRPRPLLSWENAGLVWQRAFWKTEYNNALKRIAQAFDDNRTEDLTAAKTDAAVFEDKLEELDRAVGRNGTGSEAGRTLQAQKMGAGDDFTLIEMTLQKRAAVGGRRLTAEESANLAKEHARLESLNAELQKELATRDERLAKSEADRAMAELKAKNVPTFDKRILAAAENIVSKMETAADAARERIKARFAQPGAMSGPIDPTLIDDFAVVASAKIARAGLDLAKLTDDMAREFGEMVKEHMPAIWTRANEMLDNITAKVPDPVKRIVRKQGLDEQKKVFIENIKEKAAKNEKKSFNWYVQKMARELYKSGITDREQMVDALHGLLKEAVPDITRRQTQDAFSGYGDYRPLSKEHVTVALRGMKGELQQIAKLEDMARGTPPLKSGMGRRTPTDVERQLIKLVNDAKNKFQIPVRDPETQLKSALDTLKTTLENRIKDYEDRIARKDYTTKPRREVQMDSRATQLKADMERIKKRFQAELLSDRMKNRTNWEKSLDWGTKFRRFTALSSPAVIPKLFGAAAWRGLSTLAEDISGGVLSVIPGIRQISQRAPLEGAGKQLKATMKGYGAAFTKGMKDAANVAKTGASDIDVLYGKAGESYTGEAELASLLLNIPGRSHGVIKAPVKRLGFEKAKSRLEYWHENAAQRLGEWYAKQDFPVNSDALKYRIALDAYKAGNRAIFLQDNRVASAFNAALAALERKGESGHPSPGGKVLSTAARFMFPVTRVPVNIAAETLQYTTGSVTGSVRAFNAIRKGLDTLTPNQADLIMRDLKKGSIGLAALTLGYIGYKSIGGTFQQGEKRKRGDLKPGEIKMFGETIPANLGHHPVINTINLGATIHRTADEKLRRRDADVQGLPAGVLAASWGLADEVPFVQGPHRLFGGLANKYTREKTIGTEVGSVVIPQAVAWIAQVLDERRETTPSNIYQRVTGAPAKLKPQGILQNIETRIPGLRQQIPVDTSKR